MTKNVVGYSIKKMVTATGTTWELWEWYSPGFFRPRGKLRGSYTTEQFAELALRDIVEKPFCLEEQNYDKRGQKVFYSNL